MPDKEKYEPTNDHIRQLRDNITALCVIVGMPDDSVTVLMDNAYLAGQRVALKEIRDELRNRAESG